MNKAKTTAKPVTTTAVDAPVTFKVTKDTANTLHTLAIAAGNAMKSNADALATLCAGIGKVTHGKPLAEDTVQDLLTTMQRGCKWIGKNSVKAQRTKWRAVFESYTLLPEAIKALGRHSAFHNLVGEVGSAHAFYMANKLNKRDAKISKVVAATAKFFAGKRGGKKGPRKFESADAYKRHVAIVIKALLAASAPGSREVKAALRQLGGVVNLGKA